MASVVNVHSTIDDGIGESFPSKSLVVLGTHSDRPASLTQDINNKKPKRLGLFERLLDGTVRLTYPGRRPRLYKSSKAAFNARKIFEDQDARGGPHLKLPDWTPRENAILKIVWGRLTRGNLLQALPGRTYCSIKTHARRMGFVASKNTKTIANKNKQHAWTADDLERLIAHHDDRDELLIQLPKRTRKAIAYKLIQLGLGNPKSAGWSAEEDRLLSTIQNCLSKLGYGLRRSLKSILHRSIRIERKRIRLENAITMIKPFTANYPRTVRDEIVNDIVAEVLAGSFCFEDPARSVRAAMRRIYGDHFLSLDAQVFDDGGGTYLDRVQDGHQMWGDLPNP